VTAQEHTMTGPAQNDPIQTTLDALRAVRNHLYAIPGSTVAAMSLDDQIKYGDNLQRIGTSILKLEAAKLQQVNQAFAAQQKALEDASGKLQQATDRLNDSVQLIRVVGNSLSTITNIVSLLA